MNKILKLINKSYSCIIIILKYYVNNSFLLKVYNNNVRCTRAYNEIMTGFFQNIYIIKRQILM